MKLGSIVASWNVTCYQSGNVSAITGLLIISFAGYIIITLDCWSRAIISFILAHKCLRTSNSSVGMSLLKPIPLPFNLEALEMIISISWKSRKAKRMGLCFTLPKTGKRKGQGVPQSQTAALPRHQEEEETDKSKQAQIEQNVRKALRLALSTLSEVIAMLKGLKNTRTKWHKVRHKTNHLVE